MSRKFNTTVTGEKIKRDSDGDIDEIKVKMSRGKTTYIIVCDVADDELLFERVSPVHRGGDYPSSTSIFGRSVPMMDVEKTMTVMKVAKNYVDEHYSNIDVPRSLWLDTYGDAE